MHALILSEIGHIRWCTYIQGMERKRLVPVPQLQPNNIAVYLKWLVPLLRFTFPLGSRYWGHQKTHKIRSGFFKDPLVSPCSISEGANYGLSFWMPHASRLPGIGVSKQPWQKPAGSNWHLDQLFYTVFFLCSASHNMSHFWYLSSFCMGWICGKLIEAPPASAIWGHFCWLFSTWCLGQW